MCQEGNILLNIDKDFMHKSFGYRYLIGPQTPPVQLHSFGWQIQSSPSYFFDGRKRPDEAGNCIFQYTLSGNGIIQVDGQTQNLQEGTAFIAAIPSDHQYYLPETSKQWEFVFITLYGSLPLMEWTKLQETHGCVIPFHKDDEVIKFLFETYWKAVNNEIKDGYDTSSIGYEFIMKLNRTLNHPAAKDLTSNNQIDASIRFMLNNFHRDICLDDIADNIQMSKYHFNHTFMKTVGISPWNYLTKLRIEHSIKLLVTTDYNLEEISHLVGYTSANYYNKVFHKYVGISPGKLREKYRGVNLEVNL
jgi:AraC-like DNA-binding protein